MQKILCVVLGMIFMLCGSVHALDEATGHAIPSVLYGDYEGTLIRVPIDVDGHLVTTGSVTSEQIITNITLAGLGSVTTGTLTNNGYKDIAFSVICDETDAGNLAYATVTLGISYDGVNFNEGAGYYNAGNASFATTGSIVVCEGANIDENIFIFPFPDIQIPYYRLRITGSTTVADYSIVVDAYATYLE